MKTDYYILNNHTPVLADTAEKSGLLEWGEWYDNIENRQVNQTIISDSRISTVFLGIDLSGSPEYKPALFETLVFCGPLDGKMGRCCTWEEAERMHETMCQQVRCTIAGETPKLNSAFFEKEGYTHVLYDETSDTWAALYTLITTTAIVFNLNDCGYSERYCFAEPEQALHELEQWHERGFNDQRPTSWVACRGVTGKQLIGSYMHYLPEHLIINQTIHNALFNKDDFPYMEASSSLADQFKLSQAELIHQLALVRMIHEQVFDALTGEGEE